MDLSKFNKEELLLTAIKSEVEANRIYQEVADSVRNAFLKDKLRYIADEEARHRSFLEEMYHKEFPDSDLKLPEKTAVPLPEIDISDEGISLSSVFEMAMKAELAANDFYNSFAEQYENDIKVGKTLKYFATMEMGHYRLFEIEKDNMQKFEDFDDESPMMHVGP